MSKMSALERQKECYQTYSRYFKANLNKKHVEAAIDKSLFFSIKKFPDTLSNEWQLVSLSHNLSKKKLQLPTNKNNTKILGKIESFKLICTVDRIAETQKC